MGPDKVHYLFVDAGCLRGRLDNMYKKYFGAKSYEINFSALASGFTKVFYYDAIPVREIGETENAYTQRISSQVEMLENAASVDRFHVYEGDARKRRKRQEQKKIDVMIAVDMLTHSFRRNMHETTLLTGDNDFKPLVDALVHDGMLTTLWYPPDETSKELIISADLRRPLDLRALKSILTAGSQAEFTIPTLNNYTPGFEPGSKIFEWKSKNIRHTINKEGDDFIVLKDGDMQNRLHIRHSNYALLKYFCSESMQIEIPFDP